jgi:hypothetical protein
MRTVLRTAFGCALMVLASVSAFAAVLIQSQAPCVSPPFNHCFFFQSTDPIPVITDIRFEAPGEGIASVSFHGTLVCSSTAAAGEPRVVDLVSQITSRPGNAAVDGPSGLRHAMVLLGTAAGTTDTFTLNSAREFQIDGAGKHRFFFNLLKLRMDASTSCIVYNAAFTITFVPSLESSAALVRHQKACQTTCAFFTSAIPPPVIREFEFNAPGAGTALVTFDGSLTCYYPGLGKVVDLVGQITTGSEVPAAEGPGGMRLAVVATVELASSTFNLHSTRVFSIEQAGTTAFLFKIERLRMDHYSECGALGSGAFTVFFVPN